jgi:hypothetical protein
MLGAETNALQKALGVSGRGVVEVWLIIMEESFLPAFAPSLLAAAVTTLGIVALRRYENWAHNNATYFVCFAAGVLIAVSFLHIVPTSQTMNSQAPIGPRNDAGLMSAPPAICPPEFSVVIRSPGRTGPSPDA